MAPTTYTYKLKFVEPFWWSTAFGLLMIASEIRIVPKTWLQKVAGWMATKIKVVPVKVD